MEDAAVVETVSLNDLRYGVQGAYSRPVQVTNVAARSPAVPYRRLAAPRPAPRREAPRQAARAATPPAPATKSVDVVRGTTQSSYEVGGFGG
jgi:hypothetical protein